MNLDGPCLLLALPHEFRPNFRYPEEKISISLGPSNFFPQHPQTKDDKIDNMSCFWLTPQTKPCFGNGSIRFGAFGCSVIGVIYVYMGMGQVIRYPINLWMVNTSH